VNKADQFGAEFLLYATEEEIYGVRIIAFFIQIYNLVLQNKKVGVYYLDIRDLEKHIHLFVGKLGVKAEEIEESFKLKDGECPAVQDYIRTFHNSPSGRLLSWTLFPPKSLGMARQELINITNCLGPLCVASWEELEEATLLVHTAIEEEKASSKSV
jgi:hypothetical protein